jgi:hypothetical protein
LLRVLVERAVAPVSKDTLSWLRRRKMLTPGRRSSVVWSVGGNRVGEIMIVPLEDALMLVYRTRPGGEAWRHQKQVVPFTTTATDFSGRRRSFACPQSTRPCRVLFGNGRFLCRRCWGIGYCSQRESRWSRTIHAPSHVPNAAGTLYVAVAAEHGGSAGTTRAADRRYDVSTGTRLRRPPMQTLSDAANRCSVG